MGLDTRTPVTLWKDKALVEVNLAVLHSFQVSTRQCITPSLCSLTSAATRFAINLMAKRSIVADFCHVLREKSAAVFVCCCCFGAVLSRQLHLLSVGGICRAEILAQTERGDLAAKLLIALDFSCCLLGAHRKVSSAVHFLWLPTAQYPSLFCGRTTKITCNLTSGMISRGMDL